MKKNTFKTAFTLIRTLRRKNLFRVQRGFTLIELLIVMGIIAFLAALVIALSTGQRFKGTDAKKKADLNRIKIALEEYEKDHNCYPPSELVVCKPDDTGLVPYLNNIPCDPVNGHSYLYEHQSGSCAGWFHVYTVLDNTKDSAATPGIGPLGAFNYVVSSDNAPAVVTSSSSGSGSSTPVPTPDPGTYLIPVSGYWGCISNVCTPLMWDTRIPGPQCQPTFDNSECSGQCNRAQCI